MAGEIEKPLVEVGDSTGIIIPVQWLRKKGLKKGDMLKMILNDKILLEKPKTEEELHAEIEDYEKSLKR